MKTKSPPPIIGVSGCRKDIDGYDYDSAPHMFVDALEKACGAVPLIVPTLGAALDRKTLIAHVDGLLFTGSVSNVEPHHYDGPDSVEGTAHDPHRDATTLPLIVEAVEAGVPIFCICRGFQELNVAYGGSLHQRVFEVPGLLDHRSDRTQPMDIRFDLAHEMSLVEDSYFAALAGSTTIMVNSLHGQGIERVGDGLSVQAIAPDGLVEGLTVNGARRFAAGVQWHPEFKVMDNSFSRALFEAFAESAREKAAES
ncbi:MAG: gamma-glutamyl-gamma-aminobutyrate hydrolase family protein [Rhodospirillaceae bacterium]|nr:gamma-glutamyl-gamma-aminobutyrate hydrolase family protein [Rhodospirillaceae bacterium]MBL6931081.1 gamma-glutamyl-gamma-aminobutyrate hydrolase family protein [Rhodospirillales bacterium]